MHIVLGPPGTGKTTKLLSLVESYLESGVPPDRIAYLAFTRKAAQEAVDRACLKFSFSKKELPYFRTLHSLAFQQAGLNHSQVITPDKYQEIAEWLKIGKFFIGGVTEQGPYKDFGYGDKFLEIINMARILREPLRKIYNQSIVPLKTDWARVDYVARGLEHWKEAYGLFDYTGMLELFLHRDLCPKLEVVFIDEAQDLSPIQWEMVRRLEERSKICYVAGDDDQAIFRYAGADVEQFVGLEGDVTLLDKSYRIPSLHHDLSIQVIHKIVGRREKPFTAKEDKGEIFWHRHSEEVDLSDKDWLLLSITADQVILIYKYMLLNKQIVYGYKTMPDGEDGTLYSIEDLQQSHGLLHADPWDQGLGKISQRDKVYLKACLRKGEKLDQTPRIRISTIHSAKGAEATNVMLLTDVMRRPYSMWRKINTYDEDEARVFYVGLTRAKEQLHLVHPMFSQGYALPY